MPLPSRHMIRNSSPTILNFYEWAGKKHFVSLKLEGQSGVRARDLRLPKQAALTTSPRLHLTTLSFTVKNLVNTRCHDAGLIFVQRLRRWTNIKPASRQRFVFTLFLPSLFHVIWRFNHLAFQLKQEDEPVTGYCWPNCIADYPALTL